MPTRPAAAFAAALCCPAPALALEFSDVAAGSWYGESGAVARASDEGVMTGYAGTTLFGPDDEITRADAVTALYRAVDGDAANATSDPESYAAESSAGLSDAPGGAYWTAALNWAVAEGVVTGCPDGSFRPDQPVTREELVTMIGRAVDDYPSPIDVTDVEDFWYGGVSPWAWEHAKWARNARVLCGYPVADGFVTGTYYTYCFEFYPQQSATRAEAAAMLVCLEDNVLAYLD